MGIGDSLELLQTAKRLGRVVGAFNIHSMEIGLGVVDAVNQTKTPVIIQINEAILSQASVEFFAKVGRSLADLCDVPVGLQLDHCREPENVRKAVEVGFTSVMIDASHLPLEQNINIVKEIVDFAHQRGVQVEAELGRVTGTEDGAIVNDSALSYTDPDEAVYYVHETKVDFLAVSIGTVHGVYKGLPNLDFERLQRIAELIPTPLVLHGGSGLPETDLKKCIQLGISKVNVATELKQIFVNGITAYLQRHPSTDDPIKLLGGGRKEVAKLVAEKIQVLGSL